MRHLWSKRAVSFVPTTVWKRHRRQKQKHVCFPEFDIICLDDRATVPLLVYGVSRPLPVVRFDLYVGVLFLLETLSDGTIVLFYYCIVAAE